MTKNYYAVTVKLGHVGRNKYVVKTLPIKAENGREAAKIARWSSRVKHHAKDAVIKVESINYEQYIALQQTKELDPYFHCTNIQQQRIACKDTLDDVKYEDNGLDLELLKEKRKERIDHFKKVKKQTLKECAYMMRNYFELLAY